MNAIEVGLMQMEVTIDVEYLVQVRMQGWFA